jgi:hypothetical protein
MEPTNQGNDAPPFDPFAQGSGYHTITGGKETLTELRNEGKMLPEENPPSMTVETKTAEPVVIIKKETTLFGTLFGFITAVAILLALLILASPQILELLVGKGYLLASGGGYNYGALHFTNILDGILFPVVIELVLISFGLLFLTQFVDHITPLTTNLFVKFLLFIICIVLVGFGVYFLKMQYSLDLLTLVHSYLTRQI